MKHLRFFIWALCALCANTGTAQISFTNQAGLLSPAQHFSGVAIAVIDANGDGLDDIVRMNQGRMVNLQYQTSNLTNFIPLDVMALPGDQNNPSQWGMCTADVDNNGFADILAGGRYDGIKILLADSAGTGFNYSIYTQPSTFVQAVNFADINNDGLLDAFVCHDDGISRIFENKGNGTFAYQPMWIDLRTYPTSDNSGNYGSVWSDIDNDGDTDLYIAHCRQGVNSATDPRRINQLFWNNGDGTYTQDSFNVSGLRIGLQSWTADFGDIDNDGDFDCFITNHDASSQLLENDGQGHFTEITATSGLLNAVNGSPIQGVFRDFDNDGYIDILVAGSSHHLFRNNGNKTFSEVTGLFSNSQMESFALGDLNNDGFQDIYAGYANIYTSPSNIPDALWINNGNGNHFFGLNLRGQSSNRSGVGAKVVLHSALGTQVREVRSGESYGISNSLKIHFGMGAVTEIDSVVVNWPSGVRDVLFQPSVNQYLTLFEGGCEAPTVTITPSGPTAICPGDQVTLDLPAGFQYAWNTGDTTQQITVGTAGSYHVTITTPDGCTAISNTIQVVVDPVAIPAIYASSDTVFCQGGSVTLSTDEAPAYQWSTGATTQSITIEETGDYSVAAQGLCSFFTSKVVHVEVLSAPPPAFVQDTVIATDSIAVFATLGGQISWFEDAQGGQPISQDTMLQLLINGPTTIWASATTTYDAPPIHAGMTDHMGTLFGDNSFIGGLIFDCYAPFTLVSAKFYTNTPGERRVLVEAPDGTVVASATVNIPSGTTVVDLNLNILPGLDYKIYTDPAVNQANFGSDGPRLRRSSSGISFPYEVPGLLSIKNSTFDQTRYYYFYDWLVDVPGIVCESERVPVHALLPVVSASDLVLPTEAVKVFPNPSSGRMTLTFEHPLNETLQVFVKNSQGITVAQQIVDAAAGPQTVQLDLGALPKGVYWLELAGANTLYRKTVLLH